MKKGRPPGIKIFAVLLILASIYKLSGFMDYGYYQFMFQPLDEKVIRFRFIGSVGLRVFGLAAGIGLFSYKEIYRKLFLSLAVFSLVSMPFKHPMRVFNNIALYVEHQKEVNNYPEGTVILPSTFPQYPKDHKHFELVYPAYPFVSMVVYHLIDGVFATWGIIYFTRNRIKEQFVTGEQADKIS